MFGNMDTHLPTTRYGRQQPYHTRCNIIIIVIHFIHINNLFMCVFSSEPKNNIENNIQLLNDFKVYRLLNNILREFAIS